MTNENNGTGYETFQEFKLTDGTSYKLNINSTGMEGIKDICYITMTV
jgi:hypothetical protein